MPTARKILVTSALPYANGALHLGHLVEQIQTDVWARFQRLRGNECIYICGCDSHGTPIMIQAEKQHMSPEQLVDTIRHEQMANLEGFLIAIDYYGTTHSATNKQLAQDVFHRHVERGNIHKRVINQLYDPTKNMFLPDRFIRGECPHCHAKDQYGDNCEACGSTYLPTDLINPYSTLSGAKPVEKSSEHYFF